MAWAIKCEHVVKQRAGGKAVNDASLEAQAGEITAILGQSGCGKTTLMKVIAGILAPNAGQVQLNLGDGASGGVGYVSQENALYEELTFRENAEYFAQLHGVDGGPARENLQSNAKLLGVDGLLGRQISQMSGGQKRRANIVCSLIHSPAILLLDEPTAGLDPAGRSRVWKFMRDAAGKGKAVVYSTHLLNEAEALSDTIVIMSEGAVAAHGTLESMRKLVGGEKVVRLSTKPGDPDTLAGIAADLGEKGLAGRCSVAPGRLIIETEKPSATEKRLQQLLRGTEEYIEELVILEPSLEDVFNIVTTKATE